jgi:hypothetical protein
MKIKQRCPPSAALHRFARQRGTFLAQIDTGNNHTKQTEKEKGVRRSMAKNIQKSI